MLVGFCTVKTVFNNIISVVSRMHRYMYRQLVPWNMLSGLIYFNCVDCIDSRWLSLKSPCILFTYVLKFIYVALHWPFASKVTLKHMGDIYLYTPRRGFGNVRNSSVELLVSLYSFWYRVMIKCWYLQFWNLFYCFNYSIRHHLTNWKICHSDIRSLYSASIIMVLVNLNLSNDL